MGLAHWVTLSWGQDPLQGAAVAVPFLHNPTRLMEAEPSTLSDTPHTPLAAPALSSNTSTSETLGDGDSHPVLREMESPGPQGRGSGGES